MSKLEDELVSALPRGVRLTIRELATAAKTGLTGNSPVMRKAVRRLLAAGEIVESGFKMTHGVSSRAYATDATDGPRCPGETVFTEEEGDG